MAGRSPVRLQNRAPAWPGGPRIDRWVCDVRLQSARFQDRLDHQRTAIVHRSTKYPQAWQVSFFDDQGAASDIRRTTCNEALRELSPSRWRLRDVRPKR
jgi:hypothetical protein